MADGAGHAFVLQVAIEMGVGRKDRVSLFLIVKAQNQMLLLAVKRRMAVPANPLISVEGEIHLEIGIGLGAGMHGRRPLVENVAMT